MYSFKVGTDIEMSDLGNTNSFSVHNLSQSNQKHININTYQNENGRAGAEGLDDDTENLD